MDAFFRAATIYMALWVIFRIAGRRTLAEMTTFDFVLLLIIGEATQQALLGDDFSITNSLIIIVTLLLIDVLVSLAKRRSQTVAKWVDGVPTIIVSDGKPLYDRLRMARVTEDDIMEAARRLQGLERMDQIKYAVMEVSGGITVIPHAAEPDAGTGRPPQGAE
ncbi:MAG: DUF421 domain-containing protein [Rhodospirillales bacterium]|nr:DUF421 domain-containing protein [Rhodospirillales bacterium]